VFHLRTFVYPKNSNLFLGRIGLFIERQGDGLGEATASKVYFSKKCSREKFVDKVLKIFSSSLERSKKIFVKPNIVSYEKYPTTTHPEVLGAILNRLQSREILVGDAPAIDAGRSNKILEKSPLRAVCDSYNLRLMNLYSEEMTTITSPRGFKLRVSAVPLTCDFVVSIPVLKVHGMVGVSGALKNQFGYLNKRERLTMHCGLKSLNKGIAEVNAAVPTDLFIVDGLRTMIKAQECRHGGCPADLDMMIAGTDPVSIDFFGLQLFEKIEPKFANIKREALGYIELASFYGLGSKIFECIEI
jgi:uncharacterized protein (DUF362 family)